MFSCKVYQRPTPLKICISVLGEQKYQLHFYFKKSNISLQYFVSQFPPAKGVTLLMLDLTHYGKSM